MRTVFVLFDSLNATALEPYGATTVRTPNLRAFAERAVTFDNHFVGSLPCMPARRDLHTGRLNFMHRSWGPLEPFDNSFTRLLSAAGVYTHIISDHPHYIEEGGNGYTQAFDTWDIVRGQENDPWIATVEPPVERLRRQFADQHYQFAWTGAATRGQMDRWSWKKLRHVVNREEIREEADYPIVKCFDRALDFLSRNHEAGDWFLQVEAFDPHEPFMVPERFKALYPTGWNGRVLDWPPYERTTGSAAEFEEIRANYAALVSMCDDQFGRLLAAFDTYDLWKDTCLIVSTDHGYLLAEHEWWGKNRMPYYTEISRIPLMIAHPALADLGGSRCQALTQTPDLMPTFLELYGIEVPTEVRGKSVFPALKGDSADNEPCLFGQFGGPLAITDGHYLLFRFPKNVTAEGLYEYTLSPIHMSSMFAVEELQNLTLSEPFDFTKNVRPLRIDARRDAIRPPGLSDAFEGGARSELFDLVDDPGQTTPINAPKIEEHLLGAMVRRLKEHDTPAEVYTHYGIAS